MAFITSHSPVLTMLLKPVNTDIGDSKCIKRWQQLAKVSFSVNWDVFGYLEGDQEYWNKEYCRAVLLIFIGRIQFMAGTSIRCLI